MRNTSQPEKLKHALLERLVHYYHFVSELEEQTPDGTVKSHQIAELVHMDDSLVRKDLAAINVRGNQYAGYRAAEILDAIRRRLGFDQTFRAVIIGAGRLGGAMAAYGGFRRYGVEIYGMFDIAPQKVGHTVAGYQIQPIVSLRMTVRRGDVRIAILTVPAEAVQEAADLAVAAGIKAIWNFASISLNVPEDVVVRHEHISVGLAELSYHLAQQNQSE
jgi:redox-sensing transcriptional repressor